MRRDGSQTGRFVYRVLVGTLLAVALATAFTGGVAATGDGDGVDDPDAGNVTASECLSDTSPLLLPPAACAEYQDGEACASVYFTEQCEAVEA
jgi:hypothetical protein